jgi:hypothetical protein
MSTVAAVYLSRHSLAKTDDRRIMELMRIYYANQNVRKMGEGLLGAPQPLRRRM